MLLIIETSTERGIIACIDKEKVLFDSRLPIGLQNSKHLLPELMQRVKQSAVDIKSCSGIVIGVGPGSYTGIRVGATVAKTLSFVLKVPLISINSLMTFIPSVNGKFATVIDARIGGVYFQLGSKEGEETVFFGGPQVLSLEKAAEVLMDIPYLVTPSMELLRVKLEKARKEIEGKYTAKEDWSWEECYPSAMQMAAFGQQKLLAGDVILDNSLELLYMRKTQAEIERDSNKEVQ